MTVWAYPVNMSDISQPMLQKDMLSWKWRKVIKVFLSDMKEGKIGIYIIIGEYSRKVDR